MTAALRPTGTPVVGPGRRSACATGRWGAQQRRWPSVLLVDTLVVALVAAVVAPWVGQGPVWFTDWVVGPLEGHAPGFPTGPVVQAWYRLALWAGAPTASWLVVAGALCAAGWGAAAGVRRLSGAGVVGQAVGALVVVANPWVYDRSWVGQVGVLCAYAATPMLLAHGAEAASSPERGEWRRLGVWWALASLCAVQWVWYGAAVWGVAAVVHRRRRGRWPQVVRTSGAKVWGVPPVLVPVLCASAVCVAWMAWSRPEGPVGVPALAGFATSARHGFGTLGAVLVGGGFWRAAAGHPLAVAAPWLVGAAGAAVWTWAAWGWRGRGGFFAGTVGVAVVAALGTWGPAGGAYRAAVQWVPGMAVLREPGKAVGLVMVLVALGCGCAAGDGQGRWSKVGAVAVAVLWWVALGHGVVGGLSGTIEAVDLDGRAGAEVSSVAGAVRELGDGEDVQVAALPWQGYWDPGLTGGRAVAAPVEAMVGTEVRTGCWTGLPKVYSSRCDPQLDAVMAAAAAPGGAVRARRSGVDAVVVSGPQGPPAGQMRRAGWQRRAGGEVLSLWVPDGTG